MLGIVFVFFYRIICLIICIFFVFSHFRVIFLLILLVILTGFKEELIILVDQEIKIFITLPTQRTVFHIRQSFCAVRTSLSAMIPKRAQSGMRNMNMFQYVAGFTQDLI